MNKFYVTKEIAEKLRGKCYPQVRYYGNRDEFIIPRIDEVLAWLRDENKIQVSPWYHRIKNQWTCTVNYDNGVYNSVFYLKYEDSALDGIEYVLDYLI